MNGKIKASVVIGAIIVLAGIVSVWGFSKMRQGQEEVLGAESKQSEIIIFYGKGCPHCKDLEDFIAENKLDEKVEMAKKEVWFDKENAKSLMTRAQECGIASDKVGVPFLYSSGKCLSGTPEVEDFLMEKAGLK